ncbi:hypothetical protein [Pseudomonas sp. BTN1]|uniref:hypothetical protein n=1 Tax=Pseudomonas sp. BTN1 TaxID=1750647 RepID=UPI000939D724|nr:hypothetical protein [Pseudomonas sp. BTN1]OKO47396.1 hypothetical protein BMH52_15835 [Pseudomonas sp. BTN1]
MTVSTISSVAEFDTNGVTTNYPFYFKFLASEDLVVTYVDPMGISSTLTLGTHYTVNGAGNEQGGSIVTTTALAGPGQLIVSREMDPFQPTSLRNQGKFLAETHEDVFDRLTMLVQQGFAIFKRALTRPFGRDYFFAENRRITAVKDPVDAQDAATKLWAQTYVGAVVVGMTGNPNLASNVFYLGPDGVPHVVQDMSGPNGLGLVGYDDTGTFPLSSAGFALQLMRKGSVFIAPGGPGVDDSPRINAAAAAAGVGGTVFFTRGDYLINSKVTQLDSQAWRSHGGQRAINLIKSANCDMLQTSNLSKLESINLEGAGATYTGKGIISIGFSVEIKGCRANLMKGAALSFPGNAGGTNLIAFEGSTFEPLTVPGIDFGGINTVRPIFLNGVWLSGGYIDVTGSGNGCSMSNFYITGIKHGAGAGLMHFSNGRVGNATVPFLLSGGGSTFTGVSFAGDIQIQSGVGMEFAACAASSISEDSASNSNKFFARGTITPAWTQASGSGPTLGNGSLVMNYVRDGNQVTVQLALTFGSTTYAGDAAAPWSFGLPFVASPNINVDGMAGVAFDLSGPTDFAVSGQIPAGTSQLNFGRNGSGVRAGTPFTWAAGDKLTCSFTYIAR